METLFDFAKKYKCHYPKNEQLSHFDGTSNEELISFIENP